ncbi:GNAT family N-acetyltransferase [Zunongwangia atlantica]|uniref:N-acetyltransferase GCN5 n=1 Tax=Zunongwangia atlantica 22II14-10F7 TaxID=1185767 RepID=A0A1Y1SY49_9FLAO|nr:GNAT family N-acetyltransferase [Zunongwangia atlantica]ORL43492.1 N-acetyltransferase GCN5 [Zunongwangia atlantica 22II14-10F7]ORL45660.1 N-acetyltransferase GCN5 [Zunongwangia atlantica 22II14-10F7]
MRFSGITRQNYDRVAAIYQKGIDTGMATFEISAPSFENWQKKYFEMPNFILQDNEEVIGWAGLTKVSDRCVYNGVAEVSIYIDPVFKGKGFGYILLNELIRQSEALGFWTLQCGIMEENTASINLHKKCGFRLIGFRERIGKLHGVWKNNVIMERRSKVVGI